MKYMLLLIALLSMGASQGVLAADCGGLTQPLDELKYLDEDELQRKLCKVPEFRDIYFKMMDYDNIEACSNLVNLGSKVLRKEYGAELLNTQECKELLATSAGITPWN